VSFRRSKSRECESDERRKDSFGKVDGERRDEARIDILRGG
jgi:hypothetical protein